MQPSRRGIALILVLWIVVLLSMAVLSLSLLTRTEALTTLSFKEELENKFFAEAGIRRGIMELFYRQANRNQQALLEGFEVFQWTAAVTRRKSGMAITASGSRKSRERSI